MHRVLWFLLVFLIIGCGKKSEPIIKTDMNMTTPIKCITLNTLSMEKPFVAKLQSLYLFDTRCDVKLYVTYKKDIVCNSPYNAGIKNTSSFPKSFLKLELKKGFKVIYSYYIDLYSNVDIDDIVDAFLSMKKELMLK
ncbi:MAG: hypothetical protein L3J43_11525 [Sulfurovum sp.]|nr:hypothetical protein [Sulfurovum sp.]